MAKIVLVADDDDGVRDLAELILVEAGFSVVAAADGAAALAILETRGADALVTDVRMPRMNGFELAEKAHALLPALPIILMTGYSDVPEDRRHCQALLRKPFKSSDLQNAVARFVSP